MMKRILLARYRLPREQHDPLADHNYASPSPLIQVAPAIWSHGLADFRLFPVNDIEIDPTEVVIPPDGSPQDEQKPLTTKAPTANKKRKRKRKNEYDFGPKRKRAKKKAATKVSNQQENLDATKSHTSETDSRDVSTSESNSFDPDSLNAVKDLYGHSEEKRYQEGLFSDRKLSESTSYQESLFNNQKHNDSISYQEGLFTNHTLSKPNHDLSQASTKAHTPASTKTHKPASTCVRADVLPDHVVNERSQSRDQAETTTSGHVIQDGDHGSAQTTDRMLIQTTCCQFYKSRRKPSQNEARSYRRKHGLWMKGDRCSQRLKNQTFPFHELPQHCKFYIFSLLDPATRGIAAQVCHDWRDWVMDPDSWCHLNLDFLASGLHNNPIQVKDAKRRSLARSRYDVFKARTANFAAYLSHFTPRPKSLAFSFDIGNTQDNWFSFIEALINESDLRRLRAVDLDWQTTHEKPALLETYCCIFNKARVLFKLHFNRVDVFHKMMDMLTKRAKNVESVMLPFDWSPRSVVLLTRWRALKSLCLHSYLSMRGLDQDVLDALLRSLPYLEYMQLSICIPVFSNTTLYSISHPNLQTLDLSGSHGLYLKHVDLPKLQDLWLSQNVWQGALVEEEHQTVPCVHKVLRTGLLATGRAKAISANAAVDIKIKDENKMADNEKWERGLNMMSKQYRDDLADGILGVAVPKLETLNGHKLEPFWSAFIYDDLEELLKTVCVCKKHFPTTRVWGPF